MLIGLPLLYWFAWIVGSLPQPADKDSSPSSPLVSALDDALLSLSDALEPVSSLPLVPDVEVLSLESVPPEPPLLPEPPDEPPEPPDEPLPPEGPVVVALELVPVGPVLVDVAVALLVLVEVEVALDVAVDVELPVADEPMPDVSPVLVLSPGEVVSDEQAPNRPVAATRSKVRRG